jgi:hypothetical protein
MTFVHFNDTHLHPKNPVSRTDDFNEEIFTILEQVGHVARHFKADAVCHAGDWFHRASRVPWAPLVRLLAWAAGLQRDGIAVLTIPGNHDLEHDRYESLTGLPFGALIESGLFTNVTQQVQQGVFGVPWPWASQPLDQWPAIPADAQVVLAHCFATPEGGERYGQVCHRYEDLAALAPHVKVWHFGHDHTDHGVATVGTGAKIINLGAAGRGVLDYDTLTRRVKVAVSRLPEVAGAATYVQQIALKLKPVEAVFDVALREKKQRERAEIDAFVAQLSGSLSSLLTVDYRALLDGLSLEEAVRSCVDQYILRAEEQWREP